MMDYKDFLRAAAQRGQHARSYNPAANYMPRPENTLINRFSQLADGKLGKPGLVNFLGPVVAPNLSAKLGPRGAKLGGKGG